MHIAVTGAAGFIGTHIVERLVAHGHTVRAFDAFRETPYPAQVKRHNATSLRALDVHVLEMDVSKSMSNQFNGCSAVIHLAGVGGFRGSWTNPSIHVRDNALATQSVCDSAVRAGCPTIVVASSSSVYGQVATGGVASQLAPASPYGASKLAGERLLEVYALAGCIDVHVARLFSVYGPRQRSDMAIYNIIDCALTGRTFTVFGDGRQSRGFTYVGDVAHALVALAVGEFAPAIRNIGGSSPWTLTEVIDAIGSLTGCEIPVRHEMSAPGDQTATLAPDSCLSTLLGGRAETDLRAGLLKQITWQRGLAQ